MTKKTEVPAPLAPEEATPSTGAHGPGLRLDGPNGVLLCSGVAIAALVIAVIGRVASVEAMSLGGAFVVVVFGIGASPLQLLTRLDIYARLSGAILIGLSVIVAVAALMADVRGLWQPVPAAIVVGVATVVLHALGILKLRAEPARRGRRGRAQLPPETAESAADTNAGEAGAAEEGSSEEESSEEESSEEGAAEEGAAEEESAEEGAAEEGAGEEGPPEPSAAGGGAGRLSAALKRKTKHGKKTAGRGDTSAGSGTGAQDGGEQTSSSGEDPEDGDEQTSGSGESALARDRKRVRASRKRARANQKRARATRKRVRASLFLTFVGTVLWLVPALTTHDPQPGIWGFLTVISPIWYVGLTMVVLGFVVGRRNELSAFLATSAFALVGTLTPSLVYATPRNSTAGKQMLLTQYVLTHHHIDAPAGIYQAFSALFSGMAWLSQLIGVHGMLGHDSLLGLATYWPVIFALARVVTLRFFAGRLLDTPGRIWTAVMLVMLVDTINDANYYSPQSAAYVLAIGAFGFAISGVKPRPLGNRALFWLLLVVGLALAPMHELTPYIAAGALFVLAVFGQAPLWSCLPIGIPALAWAGLVHKAVSSNFSFTQLFDLGNLLPPKTRGTPGLERFAAIGYQSHALLVALLILVGLAAIGFFPNIRRKWAWGYALCPAVGIGLILINPYGNEGIFRSSLFAIPWLAILAMKMPRPGRMLPILRRPLALNAAITAVLLGLLGTYVVAEWGVDGAYMLLRSDVAVSDYLIYNPAKHAYVVSLGAPTGTALNLPPFLVNYTPISWPLVAGQRLQDVKRPGPEDLVALTDRYGAIAVGIGATNSSPLYIFWSASTSLNSQAYGVQSAQQMNGWLAQLKASPDWRLVKRDGDTYLFKLIHG